MSLLEVGSISRPHGLTGEVVVQLVTNRLERLEVGSRLSAEAPAGRTVPPILEVVSARAHQARHLVRFAGYGDRDSAETLRGVRLLAEPVIDTAAMFVHDLIGSVIVDQDGVSRGVIVAVEANPASDLLVTDLAHLIPLRFVVDIAGKTVRVDVPQGLFE